MKDTSLEIVNYLIANKLTLAVAESLTGGIVCSRICQVPGASRVFLEGVVSYTNQSKISRLGVRKETLEKFTAVSIETAKEMAEGVCKNLGTDIGISTTGVAGPGAFDDDGNPRGLVYIGVAMGNSAWAYEYQIEGSRDYIRNKASDICLDKLFETINEREKL
ncbi:MAG: CinA family protein [Proteocatella sp.]